MCFCFSLFFLCTVLMCTAGAAIFFVCFKILWFLFCLFCNFYVLFVCSGSVQRRERPSFLFALKYCRFCFVCFVIFMFFLCAVIVCSGTGCVFLKTLSLLFCLFCNFYGFLCAVVVCSGGSGHLVIGSMALPATHRIKHPSPDLKTRKIWFSFLF